VGFISVSELSFGVIEGSFLVQTAGLLLDVVVSRSFAIEGIGRACERGLKQNRTYTLNRELNLPCLVRLQANISDPGYMIRELECSADGVTSFGREAVTH